jgi:hypothetical protein
MTDISLNEVINEAMGELESAPVEDLVDSQDEDLVDLELDETDEVDESEDEVETESDIEDEESDEESVDDGQSFTVKVDGEDVVVDLQELKAGYSRQAHFTKSMQALRDEREAFELESKGFIESVEGMQSLDAAWEENPVSVLQSLITSVDNPEYALGLLIKELASSNVLSAEALQYFGIDDETKKSWSNESEIEMLRRQVAEKEQMEEDIRSQANSVTEENRIKEAVKEFDNQIHEIVLEEGLDFDTEGERLFFRADLLKYANENGILNLRKAYAAMQYERGKSDKSLKLKNEKAVQKKSATKVISRGGAGQSGVTSIGNKNMDLKSVIEQTMKELEF